MSENNELTSYQKAYNEWDSRIGSAKKQSYNWMIASIMSLTLCLLLVVAILVESNHQQTYVYVAEVNPNESVVNVRPTTVKYTPTSAQKIAFVGSFIKNITEIPLDPVILNNQWKTALQSVSGRASDQLKQTYEAFQPLVKIGDKTVTTVITNANKASNNSYDVTFQTTTYNRDGNISSVKVYSGIFTFTKSVVPVTLYNMIVNPLGLKIGFFSFSEKGLSQ